MLIFNFAQFYKTSSDLIVILKVLSAKIAMASSIYRFGIIC